MSSPSIESKDCVRIKTDLIAEALAAGFSRARILAPFRSEAADDGRANGKGYSEGAPAALLVALPYGNEVRDEPKRTDAPLARIEIFARRDYYGEAVNRLKKIAVQLRSRLGGRRSDYRILCNSPVPEKPLAQACGLGVLGRNSLIITPEAGSLVVIAVLTLPFGLAGDEALESDYCRGCAACVSACPTGALKNTAGSGRSLDRTRCIQWFASRPGEIPEFIKSRWEDRLYGCSICRDVCPANARSIPGAKTERGALPAAFNARELAEASDAELTARFKGTALGMSWLGPEAIRRNARLAMEYGATP